MKTYKTVTVNNYFFGICERVVMEYNRNLHLDFHNYVAEMHSRIIKNKSMYVDKKGHFLED